MSQLGRIGGHLLAPNLERQGIDLAFKNTTFDDALLFLQVDPNISETVGATQLVIGQTYQIKTIGTSNFVSAGASSNAVGVIFTATSPILGTGEAFLLNDTLDPIPTAGNGSKIGIKTDAPVYDLDINSNIKTTNLSIGVIGYVDNIILNSNTDTISTVSGPINITPNQTNPLITFDKLASDNLLLNDNTISSLSNSNVTLEANGTGKLNVFSSATINGDLYVTGNITMNGNLSGAENIIVGDSPLDLVNIQTDFTQTLEPATDNTYDIGAADKRWASLWSDNWQDPDNLIITGMTISDQLRIDGTGTDGEIFALQSNDGVLLSPDTGITVIEDTSWETNNITNLLNTPLIFTSTGIGYLRFMGDNGFVIPAGNDASRPSSPEVGDTRWNTDGELLECFDAVTGTYITSIGPGEVVTQDFVEELGNVYSLILG